MAGAVAGSPPASTRCVSSTSFSWLVCLSIISFLLYLYTVVLGLTTPYSNNNQMQACFSDALKYLSVISVNVELVPVMICQLSVQGSFHVEKATKLADKMG